VPYPFLFFSSINIIVNRSCASPRASLLGAAKHPTYPNLQHTSGSHDSMPCRMACVRAVQNALFVPCRMAASWCVLELFIQASVTFLQTLVQSSQCTYGGCLWTPPRRVGGIGHSVFKSLRWRLGETHSADTESSSERTAWNENAAGTRNLKTLAQLE
jgi:hypothetical protein